MRFSFSSAVWLFFLLPVWAPPVGAQSSTPPLTRKNRLAIVRTLDFEYAIARQPLPAAKKKGEALEVASTGEVNEAKLRQGLTNRGAAIHVGEVVQITKIEFKRNSIIFEINGGGKKGRKWYQRIRVQGSIGGVGGGSPRQTSPPPRSTGDGSPEVGRGSWILLTFSDRLPDVSPEELKQMLAAVLDFSHPSPSAAVPWIETIPEEFRQAIKEKRALVGMDRRMVLAALGQPVNKVREHREGQETEDWIYGYPPFVTFVTFVEGKVVTVKEFR